MVSRWSGARRSAAALLLAALAVSTLGAGGAASAGPEPRERTAAPALAGPEPEWAPTASATIRPGVQVIGAGQCTANFVFYRVQRHPRTQRARTTHVYLGTAAHCFGEGMATDTDGCTASYGEMFTDVAVHGASRPGRLVYSAWRSMQEGAERPTAEECLYNDLALVALHPADWGAVNPSVPFWGGPDREGGVTSLGSDVYSYGASGLRLGLRALSPKQGWSVRRTGGGWSHTVYTATPGIPGDSGSAVLDAEGGALGTVSTLQLFPYTGGNGVTDLGHALAFARRRTGWDLRLALGTERFLPLLP